MQKGIELAKEAVEEDNKENWKEVGAGALDGGGSPLVVRLRFRDPCPALAAWPAGV